MNGRVYRCCMFRLTLVLAVAGFSGCRKTHRQPADALSGEQRKLSAVMSAVDESPRTPVLLSRELGKIIREVLPGDSSEKLLKEFNSRLDSAALRLSSQLLMETDARREVDAVTGCIFSRWEIGFNGDRENLRYLFPHLVVDGKQGSCVGMSLLYLLFAEKLGLPLYGVLAPGHLFVRFDNKKECFNIETLRGGEAMSDGWYRERWSIRDTNLYPLTNLSTAGVLAVVHYNIANSYLNGRRYEKARGHYQEAIALLPDFPEAQGNLALALDALGNSAKALTLLQAIRTAHPTFEKIDENLASMQLRCARYSDADATYSELCRRNPDNPQYHYGRGVALFNLKRTDESAEALRRAVRLRPDYSEARQLLERMEK